MKRHILSILVNNQAGTLSRISGLFTRRGFNIESFSAGVIGNGDLTRITVTTICDDQAIKQITRQVEKLVDVIEIIELLENTSVLRELALIKIKASNHIRTEIVGIVDIFRANIIDVSPETITVEMTGDQSKIEAFCELVSTYGIKEIARTGLAGLGRGSLSIEEKEGLPYE